MYTRKEGGYLVILALVFGGIFFLMIGAFTGFVVTQKQAEQKKAYREEALQIAEAGLDYYRWFLSHYPTDIQDGTGAAGPYVHQYQDPEGGDIGEFSLQVTGNSMCGDLMSVDITSTGSTDAEPNIKRKVFGRYAKPTVAEYAYIINSNVWAGADRTIVGPYHTNGGVRMDGTNNSTVSSGVSNWLCTGSFGCNPNATKDGVFGVGPNDELWEFPAPPIDFTGLTVDLAAMKTKAQSVGRYIGPSNDDGYRIVFKSNRTYDLYRVRSVVSGLQGYTIEDDWQTESIVYNSTTFLGNYAIPSGCGVIYVEDKVWLEGVIADKITLAAANVTSTSINPSIILQNNITYTASDGSVGLLAIAEDSILIGLNTPDDMTLNGIFVAQTGKFGRNRYDALHLSGTTYDGYVQRNSLTVNGTIVSNDREGTKWVSNGVFISGYETRTNTYDRDLVTNPPPLTPNTSDSYKFIEWREVE